MVTKLKELCNLSGGDLCWRVVRLINAIFVIIGLCLVVYWVLDRESPTKLYDSGSIVPTVVHPGDTVQVTWVTSKHRLCSGESVRVLSGECGAHILRVGEPAGPLMEQPTLSRINFVVPLDVTPGQCVYHTTIQFFCNPLQHWFPVVLQFPPLKFKVVVP